MKMDVLLVAGARPNFMKIAPLYRASLHHPDIRCRIVHTGQHYDHEMSQTFFEELEIPPPHYFLNALSGSHAEQTSRIMIGFEQVCITARPDLVMVVGDVNSTLACSIVAKKMGIKVAHVEAGLRSFDLQMPEEINRLVTDAISDYFFVTEPSGVSNLLNEGKPVGQILHVGHVMIDNLYHQLAKLQVTNTASFRGTDLKEQYADYLFLTLHRPSNVDCLETFAEIVGALNTLAESYPIVFPVHPRTRTKINEFGLRFSERIRVFPPLGYMESLNLWRDARVVLTDSGGLQEETTALGVPCVTIRENTERPVTVSEGTNILAGTTREGILDAFDRSLKRSRSKQRSPEKWDGKASARIWEALATQWHDGSVEIMAG